jgi:uncharacterized membrane protein
MRKIIISAASAVSFLTPLVLGAQTFQPTIEPFTDLLAQAQAFVNAAIPFVFALAFLFFLWGVALFIFSAGNEDAKDRGKRIMIWGIVALFVMVAVWGLVNVIAGLTGIRYDQAPAQPTPPGGA